MKYAKELEYEEKPDYKRLRHEFRVLYMESCNVKNETFLFDWQRVENKESGKIKLRGSKKSDKRGKALNIMITPLSPANGISI